MIEKLQSVDLDIIKSEIEILPKFNTIICLQGSKETSDPMIDTVGGYKSPGMTTYLKEKYNIKINQCGITLEDFQDDSKIVVLPCGHPFMKEEIFKWLTENSNRCPICRKESGIGYPKL